MRFEPWALTKAFGLPPEPVPYILGDEQGIEAFWNFAVTPWMQVTLDLQVIKGTQKQTITRIGPITFEMKDINTDTVLGLRVNLVF